MTIRLRHTSSATVLVVLFASLGYTQVSTTCGGPDAPVIRPQVWGDMEADFATLISNYYELRSTLERGLPALTVTDDPAEIWTAQRALAGRIRVARAGAIQGAFFTPAISVTFKKALTVEMDDGTLASIMDDNPGEFRHLINGTYPECKPFSTVPHNILAALPGLPADIEYRFLGHHLILFDARANVILDRIPCAIECTR